MIHHPHADSSFVSLGLVKRRRELGLRCPKSVRAYLSRLAPSSQRTTRKLLNRICSLRGARDLHVAFGWLQVEQKVIFRGRDEREHFAKQNPWAADHPHIACAYYDNVPNAVYVAPEPKNRNRNRLVIGDYQTALPAAGMFQLHDPEVHTLSSGGVCPLDGRQDDQRRTHWELPGWFYRNGMPTLGMNTKPERWNRMNDRVHVRTVGRGQEFVFDTADYDVKMVARWVERLVRAGLTR